jgi:acyl-CoA thioester hydrolase
MSIFSIEMSVRDYELDIQGIVNNSVYQNYLEHARHQFLHEKGIDFANLTEKGIILVVKSITMDFKVSLKSKDKFRVEVQTYKEGHLKLIFKQKIIRLSDNKTVLTANVIGVSLINNKLVKPDSIPEISNFIEL